MKSLGLCLLNVALLAMLVACGKDNESGKSNNDYYTNQYGTVSSGYSNVNSVISQNPCITTGTPTQNRVQLRMTVNLNSILPASSYFVGVTSSGDVAVLAGQGSTQAVFTAYICQRGVTYNQGQPQLADLRYGSYTLCGFQPLVAATLLVPGAYTPLYFRSMEGGTSVGTKFSMCAQ